MQREVAEAILRLPATEEDSLRLRSVRVFVRAYFEEVRKSLIFLGYSFRERWVRFPSPAPLLPLVRVHRINHLKVFSKDSVLLSESGMEIKLIENLMVGA